MTSHEETPGSSKTSRAPSKWGPILVVGGTGRLGFYVLQELLKQPECGRLVSVNSSQRTGHRLSDVEYRVADLRDKAAVRKVFEDVRPETVINTAMPVDAISSLTPASVLEDVLVGGQDTLVALAKEFGTKIFIGSTSANVVVGNEHINVNEKDPMWPDDSNALPYFVKRARGERRLLAADSSTLQTCSLRLPLIIGERDPAFVPNVLKVLKDGGTQVQIGDNKKKLAPISGADAARGRVLALRALLPPGNNVHGEAFYITGATPMPFWTMAQIIWTTAGWNPEKHNPWVIPFWLAMVLGAISEWMTKLLTFGTKAPDLTRHVVRFMCNEWTYDGRKAKWMLGFVARDSLEVELRKSAIWQMKNDESK